MRKFHTFLPMVALLLAGAVCRQVRAQDIPPLIPAPRQMRIVTDTPVPAQAAEEPDIRLDGSPTWDAEQYKLCVAPEGVVIRARTPQGVIWARRTLEQLQRPDGTFPAVEIDDYPEFHLRGFMYDTGRNFVDTAVLKHYIDLISAYKLNLFHWHLTDKPAWRIECRCYPQLNDARFQRPGRSPGAFYTYEEIRAVIAYAREHGVMVIPEIDIPGHSDYFDKAFGFAMDSPEGMQVLERCFEEFFAEIPVSECPFIHIGSDEVHIADPAGFMAWAQRTARRDGRTVIVWEPGLPVDSAAVRQIWRDNGNMKEQELDYPFFDSAMGYLNYSDPLLFSSQVYFHTPCFTGRRHPQAQGGILCMWNDVRAGDPQRIHIQNGMMGGVLPFAERFWNGGRIGRGGLSLLTADSAALHRFEAFQRRMVCHRDRRLASDMEGWHPIEPVQWDITLVSGQDTLRTTAVGDAVDLDALCRLHDFVRLPVDCRAVRRIVAERDTLLAVKAGFEAPARSNRISDGIADQRAWENGGILLVNGEPVEPPMWQEPGAYRFHFNTWARPEEELPYTDEQLYWLRKPVQIPLKKGVNTIELRVRRHFEGQRFHMAFVPVR